MAIQPLLDKVLLMPLGEDKKTVGGIILAPKSKDQQPIIAKVVARGPGGNINGKEIKMQINVGDKVVIDKYAGTEFEYNGQKYIVVSQDKILVVLLA